MDTDARPDVAAMLGAKVPRVLILIFFLLAYQSTLDLSAQPNLDVLELFAGVGAVASSANREGYAAAAMDLDYDRSMDVLTPLGFLATLLAVRRLRPGALLVLAPPCSSWTWTARSSTGRAVILQEGLEHHEKVHQANIVSTRTCLLWYAAHALGVRLILEQPLHRGVHLFKGRRWQQLASLHTVYKAFTYMGAFGAPTEKPSTFWSNHREWMLKLVRQLSMEDRERISENGVRLTRRTYDPDAGRWRSTGKVKELKESQAYTPEFGLALVRAWKTGCDGPERKCSTCEAGITSALKRSHGYSEERNVALLLAEPMDAWGDAGMPDVIQYLKNSSALRLPTCWPRDW